MILNTEIQPEDRLEQLLTKLKEGFTAFTPQFQTAVRYMLGNPHEVAISSMRSIAGRAGVQPATLVRLAQHLGFDGWQGIREVFVAPVRKRPQAYANRAQHVVQSSGSARMLSEMVAAQVSNLDAWQATAEDDIGHAAKLLGEAKQVYAAGFRACYPIAFTLHYIYGLFRPSISLIRGDAGTLEMELRNLTDKDVLFAVSFAPYSQEIIRVTDAAHRVGCKVIALTDSMVSPIALHADCILQFSVDSPSFFPSITAGVAAVETLVEQLLARHGIDAIKTLADAEGQLHQTGAYVTVRQ